MKKFFKITTLLLIIPLILTGCSNPHPIEDASTLIVYKDGDKFGYKDATGRVVIKAKYCAAFPFSDGLAVVIKKHFDGTECWNYIDAYGNIPFKINCYRADSFSEGYAAVKFEENGKWGYINKKGELVIEPQYDIASMFEAGTATVHIGGNAGTWQVIDIEGNVIRETEAPENYKSYVGGPLPENISFLN